MDDKRKLLLCHGFAAEHHPASIPDVVISTYCMYYNEDFIRKFKSKNAEKFLSMRNGEMYKFNIKFNQDLAFKIKIAPNGHIKSWEGEVECGLGISFMSNDIDYCTFVWQHSLIEPQCSCIWWKKRDFNNKRKRAWLSCTKFSEIQYITEITYQFTIHSLMIKYKDNNKDILYYPSLDAFKYKQVSSIEWNVDKSLVHRFRRYSNGLRFISPKMENLMIVAFPNGVHEATKNKFYFDVNLVGLPIDVSKVMTKVHINVMDKEVEYGKEFPADSYVLNDYFDTELLRDELVFKVKVVITEMYDLNDRIIPSSKWNEHNVM